MLEFAIFGCQLWRLFDRRSICATVESRDRWSKGHKLEHRDHDQYPLSLINRGATRSGQIKGGSGVEMTYGTTVRSASHVGSLAI